MNRSAGRSQGTIVPGWAPELSLLRLWSENGGPLLNLKRSAPPKLNFRKNQHDRYNPAKLGRRQIRLDLP